MIAGLITHAIAHGVEGQKDEFYDHLHITEALERLCHLTISYVTLTITQRDGTTEAISFGLHDIASSVQVNFTGSSRAPVQYDPHMASHAFCDFTSEKEALHMFFIVQLRNGSEITLFLRHGEDGVQIFEDPRLESYVTRKEPQPQPQPRSTDRSSGWFSWKGWRLW